MKSTKTSPSFSFSIQQRQVCIFSSVLQWCYFALTWPWQLTSFGPNGLAASEYNKTWVFNYGGNQMVKLCCTYPFAKANRVIMGARPMLTRFLCIHLTPVAIPNFVNVVLTPLSPSARPPRIPPDSISGCFTLQRRIDKPEGHFLELE